MSVTRSSGSTKTTSIRKPCRPCDDHGTRSACGPPHVRHIKLSVTVAPSGDSLHADSVALGDLRNGFRVRLTQDADHLVLGKSALSHSSLSQHRESSSQLSGGRMFLAVNIGVRQVARHFRTERDLRGWRTRCTPDSYVPRAATTRSICDASPRVTMTIGRPARCAVDDAREKGGHRRSTPTAYGSPATPAPSIGPARPNAPRRCNRTVQLQEWPLRPLAGAESNNDGANRRRSDEDILRPRK